MADDIDIEEHDLLDNPKIKNIFPDIASIKTEVNDYEEEGFDIEEENYEYDQDSIPEYLEDIPNLYQNKIILGSKPCESSESEEEESEPEIMESSVVLEDWGEMLKNSTCYCRDCEILFPTENALDSHKMLAHSFLVAVGRNKAVKSTAKSSLPARLKFESDSDTETWNHSTHSQVSSKEISLLKDSYERLTNKLTCGVCKLSFDDQMSFMEHLKIHSSGLMYRCKVCTCYFTYKKKFLTHMLYQHHVKASVSQRVKSTNTCPFCSVTLKDSRYYNKHILRAHPHMFRKIVKSENNIDFKCEHCPLKFPSEYSRRIHNVAQHRVKSDAPSKFVNLKSKLNQGSLKQEFNRRPVPKSTLFKCKKCRVHFLSSLMALQHAKKCVMKESSWKCSKCKRPFRLVDRQVHLTQHNWTEKFKIIMVDEKMSSSVILCRCLSCKECSDEATLIKNHERGCGKSISIQCSICKICIHPNAIKNHVKAHKEIGPENFVTVDYVNFNTNFIPDSTKVAKVAEKPRMTKVAKVAKKPRMTGMKKFKFYYYCPTCRCYMKISKLTDGHSRGVCNKLLPKCVCKSCGLTFSTKSFVTHLKEHVSFPHLKLRELTFKCTQSGKKINPPPPDFTKCSNCNVKFVSTVALESHVCSEDEAKTCAYCNEKFSELAYKLHIPFHEYARDRTKLLQPGKANPSAFGSIPDLIKKYDSMKIIWNILFLCETCDIIFDDYDELVEHSQNHFCNMESYNITINQCDSCDLKFVSQSYEKHKNLHQAKPITKNSFKILKFNFNNLLTNSWNDIFTVLAKEQLDQILNKSKYKHTRCVRMNTTVDGLIDLTLYSCSVCKTIIDWNMIEEHSRNKNNCFNTTKFDCNLCHLSFASKYSLNSHEYLHEKRRARIVSFNDQADTFINDALRSKMMPVSLKFIRCQQCGKLIHKMKYDKHVQKHKNILKSKAVTKKIVKKQPKFNPTQQSKKLVKPKFSKGDEKKKVHKFFKCGKCGTCVLTKVKSHICSLDSQRQQCKKCHMWFRSSHMSRHMAYHNMYHVNKDNIHVYTFKDGKISKGPGEKVVLYQCADCSVCLHKGRNIKRHICIRLSYQKLCDLCEMPFHCSRIQLHQRLHDDMDFSKKNIIVKKFRSLKLLDNVDNEVVKPNLPSPVIRKPTAAPKIDKPKTFKRSLDEEIPQKYNNREFLRFIQIRLYKCKCKLLFITPESFLKHASRCENDRIGVTCNICGLIFHKSSIQLHKNVSRCRKDSTTIFINTLNGDPLSLDDEKCIYGCFRCNINYLSFRATMNHIVLNHAVKLTPASCDACGLIFSARSHVPHQQMHHNDDSTQDDINKFIVTSMTQARAKIDLPDANEVMIEEYVETESVELNFEAEPSVSKRLSMKRKISIDDASLKKIRVETDSEQDLSIIDNSTYKLYPCKTCNLNFLSIRTLKRHLFGSHGEKQYKCSKCNLNFTQNSLTRHMKAHHRNQNYTNYELNYDFYVAMEKAEIENKLDVNSENVDKENVNEETIAVKENATEKQQQQTNNKTTNKLYKCNKCDVYYLLSEACRDHVINHTILDPTEYIACKICDLQFLCEYLGSHMKGHREKTFNIDDVIVEEYLFKDGDIKIDSYPAVDRLKSKLVTTTTHFDTEDDKNGDSTMGSSVSLNDSRNEFSNTSNTSVNKPELKSSDAGNTVNVFSNLFPSKTGGS